MRMTGGEGQKGGGAGETVVMRVGWGAAPVNSMDKDKWSAAALQPGRKTLRPPRRAALPSLCDMSSSA